MSTGRGADTTVTRVRQASAARAYGGRNAYVMNGFIFGLKVSISILLPDQLKFGVQNLTSNLLVPRAPCRVNPALALLGHFYINLYVTR